MSYLLQIYDLYLGGKNKNKKSHICYMFTFTYIQLGLCFIYDSLYSPLLQTEINPFPIPEEYETIQEISPFHLEKKMKKFKELKLDLFIYSNNP